MVSEKGTTLKVLRTLIDSGLVGSGGVPREQKMFNIHLPRVIHHQAY